MEDLEQKLASERHCLATQLNDLEVRLLSERHARREAEDMHAKVTGHLKEAVENLIVASAKLDDSEKASSLRSDDVQRLRTENAELSNRIGRLEDQLRDSSH